MNMDCAIDDACIKNKIILIFVLLSPRVILFMLNSVAFLYN